MTDNDITTICSKIESLHIKILKSNFSEMVTESEILCLILAAQELNRQKAEIKEWKRVVETWLMQHEKDRAEIKRLQTDNSSMQSTLAKMSMGVAEARAEAIKEFAEKLKGMWTIASPEPYNTDAVEVLESIDNLAKEMVGEG